MNRYREQVAAAVEAVTIRGATQYAWLGHRSRRAPASIDAGLDDAQRRRYLVSCLREELYASFYCHGRPVVARWGEPQPASPDPWLLDAMARAHARRTVWERGWTVVRVAADEAVVANSRLRVRIPVADCDGDVVPGAAVRIRVPNELPAVSPGFWTVLGDVASEGASEADVRVYWSATRAGAPALVAKLTSGLNEARVPFRLKLADHPARLDRCDAAVLYLDCEDFRGVRPLLAEVAVELRANLRPAVPAFTLRLAPGVGLAEHARGDSFGLGRCALLADAIVRAHELGLSAIDQRVDYVAARFAQEGVQIDAPYLEPSLAGRHVL